MTDEARRRPSPAHTLLTYPCGIAEGDRLRLRRPLRLETGTGSPVGVIIGAASVWTVLAGHPDEPGVVWFEDPRGELHAWDDASIGLDFETADVD